MVCMHPVALQAVSNPEVSGADSAPRRRKEKEREREKKDGPGNFEPAAGGPIHAARRLGEDQKTLIPFTASAKRLSD